MGRHGVGKRSRPFPGELGHLMIGPGGFHILLRLRDGGLRLAHAGPSLPNLCARCTGIEFHQQIASLYKVAGTDMDRPHMRHGVAGDRGGVAPADGRGRHVIGIKNRTRHRMHRDFLRRAPYCRMFCLGRSSASDREAGHNDQ